MRKPLQLACIVAHADIDLAESANSIDRLTIQTNAIMLLLIATLALVAWCAFFSTFLAPSAALALAMLVAAIIFMLDRAMAASDWELAGVLASGSPTATYWAKLAVRVAVAYVLALATAQGAALVFCGDAIRERLQREQTLVNAPLLKEYVDRIERQRVADVGAIEREISALRDEQIRIQKSLTASDSQVQRLREDAANAAVEKQRQLDGGRVGYAAGDGKLYRGAAALHATATASAKAMAVEARQAMERLDSVTVAIQARATAIEARNDRATKSLKESETNVRKDDRWVPLNDGPLKRWIALEALRSDPEAGAAVKSFSTLATSVLMVLELAFLAIKCLFSPASVYVVELVARTKLSAYRADARFARELAAVQAQAAVQAAAAPQEGGVKRPLRIIA